MYKVRLMLRTFIGIIFTLVVALPALAGEAVLSLTLKNDTGKGLIFTYPAAPDESKQVPLSVNANSSKTYQLTDAPFTYQGVYSGTFATKIFALTYKLGDDNNANLCKKESTDTLDLNAMKRITISLSNLDLDKQTVEVSCGH